MLARKLKPVHPHGGMTVKKWNVRIASVLALCCLLSPALAADSPAVMGVLEIRGLDSLAASAFELSKAAGSPLPKEMVSMMLYRALGTMPGMGIKPEDTVRAIAFENGTDRGGLAILLPVVNEGADYLAGLGQSGWETEGETAEGIQHFTAPDGSGLAWPEVYFLKRGPTLVAGRTADDVRKADAAMGSLPPILPVEGDVAFQIRPAALVDAFSPQISEQMDKAFKAPDMPPEAAAMGALYARTYVTAAKQVREYVIGLGVANGNLNIHQRVAPVAGTTLARWFETVKSPSAAAAVVALPEALGAETINLGDLNLLAAPYFRFADEMMKAMPAQPDAEWMKTYMDSLKTYWAQLDGHMGFALMPPSPENPLRFVEYIGLKDSTGLRELTRQMVQSVNEMMKAVAGDTNQPMPFKIEITTGEPREYRGIAVDKLSYAIAPDKTMSSFWPKGIPTKFDIEMAWVPGGVLASVGEPALTETLVDRALDGAAPLSDLPAWKAAYPAPEKNVVDVAHLALFDAIRAYAGLFDSQAGSGTVESVPAGSGNLESASYMAFGGWMSRLRFSMADIEAIGRKVKEAQEKAMAEMQKQMEMQGEMQIEEEEEAEDNGNAEGWGAGIDEDSSEKEAREAEETVPPVEEVPTPAMTPANPSAPAAE